MKYLRRYEAFEQRQGEKLSKGINVYVAIDKVLKETKYKILQLPPYHLDLIP